ncbi:pleckstrin homology domain-containing family A member 3-like [Aplochiton taeniatus]
MEGVLHKWTNYMTGWQPRWFVLDDGVLSYYDSQDDVGKGSKGSIKMSVCEIKVHPTDWSRVDLIIPGEQHFYVRSPHAAERQRWLVALGSSKAGALDTHAHRDSSCLRTKMSELRLYCDLLVQQVSTIQSESALEAAATSTSESCLLSATCSTFIRTLEECMTLANATFTPDLRTLLPLSPSGLAGCVVVSYRSTFPPKECVCGVQRSNQCSRNRTCSDSSVYDPDRALPCLNGDPSIPEERVRGASHRTTPTDTDSDLSI